MLLTIFSAAESKAEPSSQLCASVSLPLSVHLLGLLTQQRKTGSDASKNGLFSARILLKSLINQLQLSLGTVTFGS